MHLNDILNRLWNDYSSQNPSVQSIHSLFQSKGESIVNDHIAFRTFNRPGLRVNDLAKPFLAVGYVEKGQYHFEEKKLFAKHFELPGNYLAPRIFISELLVDQFSPFLISAVDEIVAKIPKSMLGSNDLIFSGTLWGKPNWETYLRLRDESEYAAWLYVYGYRANHFTVSVNYLKNYGTMELTNAFLKESGFKLNSSGGEIKGTPEEHLQQSSTLADIVSVEFDDRVEQIPACYYEFALRFPDSDGKIYNGFIAKSANKIFESTNFYRK